MTSLKRGYKLVKFKVNQRLKGVGVSDTPWFDEETLAWFEERLPRAKSYLEFGSGGSTLMASRLGIPTISVEGDHYFAKVVSKRLKPGHKVQVLRPPIGMTGLWGVPFPGSPTPQRVRKWRSYIDLPFEALAKSAHAFPDLFLVDGRFRNACALRAALEAKQAGCDAELLFDDYYSDGRSNYAAVEELLGEPEPVGRSALFRTRNAKDISAERIEQALADWR